MYSYIIGAVVEVNYNNIILENNNIGYKIFLSNPYKYEIGVNKKIYIHNHVTDNETLLYGFDSKEDYNLFIKLIGVKGLGPKVGSNFFANETNQDIINSINNEDISYLKKFPKVGDKLARQIILDLKGKLTLEENVKKDDVFLALQSLGYNKNEVTSVLSTIDQNKEESIQIKEALKKLMK
ncbi:MAG: Holliday junction branch migration protein RuvA [bacterium]